MGRLTKIILSDAERTALEKGYKHGTTHAFRQHCRMILLKAQHKTSKDIAAQLDCCLITVNHWVKRYQAEGIAGLHIKEGRGRKPILQTETDLIAVRRAVQENRQRLSLAQDALQMELGKSFSRDTLVRFLKKTVADSSGFDGG
jgi:transposase